MPKGKRGSGLKDTKIRELRGGVEALGSVMMSALAEKDAEIARLRAALEVIAGSSDRLQAMQARCALDNIGPDIDQQQARREE